MKRKNKYLEMGVLVGIIFGMGSAVTLFSLTTATASWALIGLGALIGLIIGTALDFAGNARQNRK